MTRRPTSPKSKLLRGAELYLRAIKISAPHPLRRKLVKEAAALGDPDANYDLWMDYERRDPKRALECAHKAVLADDSIVLIDVSMGYIYGPDHWFRHRADHVGPNPALGVSWLRAAARRGNAEAMDLLSDVYRTGGPIKRNDRLSFAWLSRAAHHGNASAMNSLGFRYKYGEGIPHDPARMIHWYRKAAALGNEDALNNLGLCYLHGDGVRKNHRRFFELTWKAAKSEYPPAVVRIGEAFLDGTGVAKDSARGARWLRKYERRGWGRARRELATRLLSGRGVRKNVREGIALLRKGARERDPEAMRLLGDHFHDLDTKPAIRRGIALFRRAASLGNSSAMTDLHDCYAEGHPGVLRRNDRAAVKWLRKALALDDRWARYVIAERMIEGRGVRRNLRGGIRLLRQSATEDEEGLAYALLAECSLTGRGMKRDVRQAIKWFREAGKCGTDRTARLRECRKLLRTRTINRSRG